MLSPVRSVPTFRFFLYGPPAYFSGAGDVMEEIYRPLTGTPVALVKPREGGVSARDAYIRFDEDPVEPADLEPMLEACVHTTRRPSSRTCPITSLLPPARSCRRSPRVLDWIRMQLGVRAADVSGSGSVVFAICDTQMAADAIALAALNEHDWWAQSAKLAKTGPTIVVG